MNDKVLGFYDYVALVTPGAAFLFGLFFVSPELKALFTAEGVTVGNLGLFVLMSYVAGHLLAAGGNLLEWAWWRAWRGLPTDRLLTDGKLLSNGARADLEKRAAALPCMHAGPGPGKAAWADAVRMMAAEVRNAGRAARLDIFNAQYGMHRNLAAALAGVTLAALAAAPHRWGVAMCGMVLAAAALARMHRFGVYYARELASSFCLLSGPGGPVRGSHPIEQEPFSRPATPTG